MEFQRVTEIRSRDGHPVPAYLWVPPDARVVGEIGLEIAVAVERIW